jgi:hypothetical protein
VHTIINLLVRLSNLPEELRFVSSLEQYVLFNFANPVTLSHVQVANCFGLSYMKTQALEKVTDLFFSSTNVRYALLEASSQVTPASC